jgi:hypothetical protein
MELAQLMLLVTFVGTCGPLFYTLGNMFLKVIGIHCREYGTNADPSQCHILMQFLKKNQYIATSSHASEMPIGIVVGKWWVAWVVTVNIQKRDSVAIGYTVSFWASIRGHALIFPQDLDTVKVETNVSPDVTNLHTLSVWRHDGPFKETKLSEETISFVHDHCEKQLDVVNKMVEMVTASKENGHGNRLCVAIAGPSGTGKSRIVRAFALAIGAKIADDFHPTQAGENMSALLRITKPTKKNPLVIVLEEVDQIFKAIHQDNVKDHEFLVTPVRDKPGWNTFMDRFVEVENVFLIMTTNMPFENIDKMDPSFMRQGRVDLRVNFGGDERYNPKDAKTGQFLHIPPFPNIAMSSSAERFAPRKLKAVKQPVFNVMNVTTSNSITITVVNHEESSGPKSKTA